jgi:hypothetical protein
MPNNSPTTIGVGLRLTIVESIGTLGDDSNGQSLRGLNVNAFPDSALVWVRNSNRMYKLKKNMAIASAQDITGFDNVINSIGSSPVNGRWVAVLQMGLASLEADEGGSTTTIGGFETGGINGYFHCTYKTIRGTPGFLTAEVTSETEISVFSTSTTDTSDVFVTFYETPETE